jgi:hypothetical protein
MKTRILSLVLAVLCSHAFASLDPASYEEITVRMKVGERLDSIMKDVRARKLLYPLTAEQLTFIARLGGRTELIRELQQPALVAPREVSDAVVLRKAKAREALLAANPEVANRPTLLTKPVPLPEDSKRLVIEKIIVQREPLHTPFHVYFKATANNGQAVAEFRKPGQIFELSGIDPRVEIPVNLVLNDVRENDWATVNLNLDTDDRAVATTAARKKNVARFPITNESYLGSPFEFNPPRATYLVSDETNQEFRYQVYWHVE